MRPKSTLPRSGPHPPVARTCQTCAQPFTVGAAEVRRNGGKFCSPSCYFNRPRPSLAERLARYTARGESCWLWTGSRRTTGYGQINVDGRPRPASIAAWLATGATIPPGHLICHICDTPLCIRNDDVGTYTVNGQVYPRRGHLFCAPQAGNMADAAAKGRSARGERHSSRRHPERVPRGERHVHARLTEAQVLEIRRRYADGESQSRLAAAFGVSPAAIALIVERKRWAHVRDSYQRR